MTKLEWRRRALGLTQAEVASLSRLQQSDVSRFERLRAVPYRPQSERLARVLNLKSHELQELVEEEAPRATLEVVPAGGV